MKSLMFLVSILFVSGAWAKTTESCYKMSVQVNAPAKSTILKLNDKFCIVDGGTWKASPVASGVEEGKIVFKIKGIKGQIRAKYEMIYSFGDGAAGTYYNTYAATESAILTATTTADNNFETIVLITNAAATEANPSYYGRIELFGTNFILTK